MTKVYSTKSSATRAAKAAASKAPEGVSYTVDSVEGGWAVTQHLTEAMQKEAEGYAADAAEEQAQGQVDLDGMGFYGLGSDEATAECPHCGTNHIDNGYSEGDQHEFCCLGCGGEWGQAQESFAYLFDLHGGNQPRGICKALRAIAVDWNGSRKSFLAGAAECNLNLANAAAEWQVARKK